MSIERLTTFQGLTVDDKIVEGDLIHLKGYPHRFIQNEKGGNVPVIFGSEKIKVGSKFVPIDSVSKYHPKTLTGDFLIKSLGFIEEEVSETQKVYMHGVWEVTIIDSDADNPVITLCANDSEITFPGAHTEKDLKDLLFFYYGEEEYGKIFH